MRAITRAATALVAVILCLAGGWSPSAASNRGVHHQIEVRLDPESGGIQVKDVMTCRLRPADQRIECWRTGGCRLVEEHASHNRQRRPLQTGYPVRQM